MRKPWVATVADSMSTAMAREMLMSRRSFDQRNSQLRSSLVTTVPVRNRRFSASPRSPVTFATAS